MALPIVILMLAVVGTEQEVGAAFVELIAGVAIGIVVPWATARLERSEFLAAHGVYEPLNGFAIGLLVYAVAAATHANLFLAAFAAGVTVATIAPRTRRAFHDFGDPVAELLKLAALFVFGLLINPAIISDVTVGGYVFVALALLLVRPVAITVALAGVACRGRSWPPRPGSGRRDSPRWSTAC